MPSRRPFGVTLLLWWVLILSAWGAIRFTAALRWGDVLNEFEARLSPLYLSITGAGWGVAGGVLFWGIASRMRWSRTAALAGTIVWQMELWVERLLFESPSSNLPYAYTITCLLVAAIGIITLHPRTRQYLTRIEEHEQPDQNPKTE